MSKIIFLLCGLMAVSHQFSIDGFGAIPNNSTLEAAWINQKAFTLAMQYANSSAIDRTVHVMGNDDFSSSSSKNREYYMMPVRADNLHDVTFYIDGEIVYSDDRDAFPSDDGKNVNDLFALNNCSNITFTGSGTGVIEGQGYWWWVH